MITNECKRSTRNGAFAKEARGKRFGLVSERRGTQPAQGLGVGFPAKRIAGQETRIIRFVNVVRHHHPAHIVYELITVQDGNIGDDSDHNQSFTTPNISMEGGRYGREVGECQNVLSGIQNRMSSGGGINPAEDSQTLHAECHHSG